MAKKRLKRRNSKRSQIATSKLEDKFEMMLILLGMKKGIHYERQHHIPAIYSYFDFKILKRNILIEVDGDYWHCNPNTKHALPITEAQIKTVMKDRIKNDYCRRNKIKLYRFWETDINNTPEKVLDILRTILS